MKNSAIEWTDHTFNPWEGCQKVGPGCDHCYAETHNARFAGGTAINWGPGAPRRRTTAANWRKPLAWNKNHEAFFAQHGRRQRVFCASLADVFDNEVDPQWRADLILLIKQTPHLDWLLLTKRIGNAHEMLNEACRKVLGNSVCGWSNNPLKSGPILENVWIGATIINQAEADRDIPKLLAVPAAKRFLSMEPLLGPVNLRLPTRTWTNSGGYATCDHCCNNDRCDDPTHLSRGRPDYAPHRRCPHCRGTGNGKPICWVILGGESGPGARPMHPDWARSLRSQCEAAGVQFFFKQWGEWQPRDHATTGADPEQEQAYLRADATEPGQLLSGDCMQFSRIGKKAAGRILDGRTWDEVPDNA